MPVVFVRRASWVYLMDINVKCEFRGRSLILSVCQITDADIGQVS